MLHTALALALGLSGTPSTIDHSDIRWVHDDWSAAKERATKENKSIAVDVWATWCHTCLSMKNFVLTDAAMKPVSKDYVWLALDYDLPSNAAFFKRHPIDAFPTFMVIAPGDGQVLARWAGSGTAEQMVHFLKGAKHRRDSALGQAEQALAKGDYAAAALTLKRAIGKSRQDEEKTLLIAAYMQALYKLDKERCAREGLTYLGETNNTAPGIDTVSYAAYCAMGQKTPLKTRVMKAVVKRLSAAAKMKKLPLEIDDHSALLGTLAEAQKTLGNDKQAQATLRRQLALLEGAAKRAKTAAQRITFDAHRFDVYTKLGMLDKAELMLKASRTDQPKDFNHPWRLAKLYKEQGRIGEGLAAIDAALAVGYGGRRLRLYTTKIELLLENGAVSEAEDLVRKARADMSKFDPSLIRDYYQKEFDAAVGAIAKRKKNAG